MAYIREKRRRFSVHTVTVSLAVLLATGCGGSGTETISSGEVAEFNSQSASAVSAPNAENENATVELVQTSEQTATSINEGLTDPSLTIGAGLDEIAVETLENPTPAEIKPVLNSLVSASGPLIGTIKVQIQKFKPTDTRQTVAVSSKKFLTPISQAESVEVQDQYYFYNQKVEQDYLDGGLGCYISGINDQIIDIDTTFAPFYKPTVGMDPGEPVSLLASEPAFIVGNELMDNMPLERSRVGVNYSFDVVLNHTPESMSLSLPGSSDISPTVFPLPVIKDSGKITAPVTQSATGTVVSPLTAESVIEWVPTNNPSDFVSISATQKLILSDGDEFLVGFNCRVQDDGHFELSRSQKLAIYGLLSTRERGQLADSQDQHFVADYLSFYHFENTFQSIGGINIFATARAEAEYTYSAQP